MGGTEGIGINFLEETFGSLQANPDHRLHAVAARRVLRALLPNLSTDIRGHMRSQQELREASGYQDQPSSFAELLRILDGELRLITPTDPEGKDEIGRMKDEIRESADSSFIPHPSSFGYYQLTHDYLVPPLRDWLTQKQKETWRGRSQLTLEERSVEWNRRPNHGHLPSMWEWISIWILTDRKKWTKPQRKMMRKPFIAFPLKFLMLFSTCLMTGSILVNGLIVIMTGQNQFALTIDDAVHNQRLWEEHERQEASQKQFIAQHNLVYTKIAQMRLRMHSMETELESVKLENKALRKLSE